MKKPTTNNQISIDTAASEAVKIISDAASKATTAIADAALSASKLLASNAAEAVKVSSVKDGNDHDLLQRLDQKVDSLKEDIKEIKDGTAVKIADHELRLNKLETNNTTINVKVAIGIGILTLLVSLLIYHLFQA